MDLNLMHNNIRRNNIAPFKHLAFLVYVGDFANGCAKLGDFINFSREITFDYKLAVGNSLFKTA